MARKILRADLPTELWDSVEKSCFVATTLTELKAWIFEQVESSEQEGEYTVAVEACEIPPISVGLLCEVINSNGGNWCCNAKPHGSFKATRRGDTTRVRWMGAQQ